MIGKISQNMTKCAKAPYESAKALHQTYLETPNTNNKPCFEAAYLSDSVKSVNLKGSMRVTILGYF